ncbi:ATP-dependent DNA helicase RecG [bacterium]|nr:MAG: ATP-dependent DNA helicase RecG [bacterium]
MTTSEHDWQTRPVESLTGVGSALAAKLARLGIQTAGELVRHYPRRYDDFSQIIPIKSMRPGKVTFKGQIERIAARYARGRKLHLTEAIITDGTGTVKAIWFNQSYLAKTFVQGTPVLLSGELKFVRNDLAMQSPAIEKTEAGRATKSTARIVPVYGETSGLSSKQLRAVMLPLMPLLATIVDELPETVRQQNQLVDLATALQHIHFPENQSQLAAAKARLAFDELWYLMLTSLVIKQEIATEPAPAIGFEVEVAQEFTRQLGFELTPHQKQAAWEILQDLGKTTPMNRLLEGDVGSGKTVVAAMAATMVMYAGYQAALMVPTEVLARQHAASLEPLFAKLGYPVSLVLGGQPAAAARAARQSLQTTEPRLIIGTQALLSDATRFGRLGLVIVDEQHRFGVNQRQLLKSKAGSLPHLLTMTATPIPRTLQLTVYGDLDISIIGAVPPGRTAITTKLADTAKREEVYQFVREQLTAGRQAFVVCPLIEDSDTRQVKSVTSEYERLKFGPFTRYKVGLLHGRLSAADKAAVMDQFAAGSIDILVTTTVIEVGVNVPNATVMLIENAETFGLAALHQLRGRVGRGEHASYCYLLADTKSTGTLERLRAIEKSTDGFRLAQIDLELRGPGQIYGRMQHGQLELDQADLTDVATLTKVRQSALKFLSDPQSLVKYPQVLARINALKSLTSLD